MKTAPDYTAMYTIGHFWDMRLSHCPPLPRPRTPVSAYSTYTIYNIYLSVIQLLWAQQHFRSEQCLQQPAGDKMYILACSATWGVTRWSRLSCLNMVSKNFSIFTRSSLGTDMQLLYWQVSPQTGILLEKCTVTTVRHCSEIRRIGLHQGSFTEQTFWIFNAEVSWFKIHYARKGSGDQLIGFVQVPRSGPGHGS